MPNADFSTATQTVSQNISLVGIQVDLDAPSLLDVEVPWTLTGTAVNGIDYTLVATSPLIIPAGDTSGIFSIHIVDQNITTSNKTIIVTMGTPVNANAGTITVETVTITYADTIPYYPVLTPLQMGEKDGYFQTAIIQSDGTYTLQEGTLEDGKIIYVVQTNGLSLAALKTAAHNSFDAFANSL